MALFNSSVNKFAWTLRKAFPSLTWKECFHLAVNCGQVDRNLFSASSIFGTWSLESQHSMAGHFWALNKTYENLGDTGRAYKFKQVASLLYSLCDEGICFSFAQVVSRKGWSLAIMVEMVQFYWSGSTGGIDTTDRMIRLLNQGAYNHSYYKNPRWVV